MSVPADILDRLTRIDMPRLPRRPRPDASLDLDGASVPVFRTPALVVGSGAAGWRSAIELVRRGVTPLMASASPWGGTSACSGSDKQTLHTAGTSRCGDDFRTLTADLAAGGCMDEDSAYIEAVGSIEALGGLLHLGLPLPRDRFGAVLRYQTDHDAVGRATSCGPRTSRLMVKVLAEEALRLGVPLLAHHEVVRLITAGEGPARRCLGAVLLDLDAAARAPAAGLVLVLAGAVLLANGGPGELYRDSVYPAGCHGGLGLALEAGVTCCNLTESQFGIGTRREAFPWNLSGTYVQVVPRIVSRDAAGREHDFLARYFRTPREIAGNTFRKGYQWPFHATRMCGFGSSLLDLAVYREERAGRQVLLDFTANPPGFSLDDLDDDARTYLARGDGLRPTPLARLERMNPLAIELYRMHGHDLARDPLPFSVNNQHLNGGVAVDAWMRSDLPGLLAVGEVAGTHGVTRPGGAALNAGQVGAIRAGERIAHDRVAPGEAGAPALAALRAVRDELAGSLGATGPTWTEVRDTVRARMSDEAGFLCDATRLPEEAAAATALRRQAATCGLRARNAKEAIDALRWRQHTLASEAILAALARYAADGGGSRGARALLGPDGSERVEAQTEDLSALRILRERPEDRTRKLCVRLRGDELAVTPQPLRRIENLDAICFERHWPDFLTGGLLADGYRHG